MEDKKNIFKELRLSLNNGAGISQRALSQILGISDARICDLELGRRKPSKAQLAAYHQYFGVSVERLMGLEDVIDVDAIEAIPVITGAPIIDAALSNSENANKKPAAPDKQDKYAEVKDILFNTLYGSYVMERLDKILTNDDINEDTDNKVNKKAVYEDLEKLLVIGERKLYNSYTSLELAILLDNTIKEKSEDE